MKNILAIDTATKLMGVSLKTNDSVISQSINDGFAHSENLLPTIDTLLNKAGIKVVDLDLLICSRGPGSFTGLRIGMATLKGLSQGLDIPLVSVPTLDLYAFDNNNFNGTVLPIIDARKKCFYTAVYRNGLKETSDLDIDLNEILNITKNDNKILLTGIDADIVYEKLKDDSRFALNDNYHRDYSNSLIDIGLSYYEKNGPDSISQGPLYIRKSEAEIMLEKKGK